MSAALLGPDISAFAVQSTGCILLDSGDFNFTAPSAGTFARIQDYVLTAGEVITITWSGTASVDYLIDGATVVDTAAASGTATYTAAAFGTYTFDKIVGVNSLPASVTTTCDEAPPPPPPPGDATARDADDMLDDQAALEVARVITIYGLLDAMFGILGPETNPPPLTLDDPADPVDTDEEDTGEGDPESVLYFPEPMTRYSALRAISAATVGERNVTGGDTALGFLATPTSFSSSALLGVAGDWTFHAQIDGAFVQRTFAALSAQTAVGTLTLMGTHKLDEDTGIGLGIKLGMARSNSNIPVIVNSAQFGADFSIVQVLGPDLTASGYAGYEFGAHSGSIGGIAGSYTSHTLKIAGRLQGNYEVGDVLLSPAIFALLTDRYRSSFVDAALVNNPASNTVSLDVAAGGRISMPLDMNDNRVAVTPFVGGNLLVNVRSNSLDPTDSPAIPYDMFRGELLGGLALAFEGGATASVQGNVSKGPRSMSYGVSGTLSIPMS